MKDLFCMNCHETARSLLAMAVLKELGAKGSPERVMDCRSPDGHKLVRRLDIDVWVVKVKWAGNRVGFDRAVYVPKNTQLPGVWKYAYQQYAYADSLKILSKKDGGGVW